MSKDINLRIKASILGINAEDYYSDKTLEDADLLGTGSLELPADFWEKSQIESWQDGSRTFYRLRAAGSADEADARRFCSALSAEGTECIPVEIR